MKRVCLPQSITDTFKQNQNKTDKDSRNRFKATPWSINIHRFKINIHTNPLYQSIQRKERRGTKRLTRMSNGSKLNPTSNLQSIHLNIALTTNLIYRNENDELELWKPQNIQRIMNEIPKYTMLFARFRSTKGSFAQRKYTKMPRWTSEWAVQKWKNGTFAQRTTRWQPRSASNQRAKSRSYCKFGIIRCSFAPLSLSENASFAQRALPSLSESEISCIISLHNSTNPEAYLLKNGSSLALERCLRHLLLIAPQSAQNLHETHTKTHKHNE